MIRFFNSLFVALTLSIPACAGADAPAARPSTYELVAFSAPWCYACTKEIPYVDAAAAAKGIKFTIYLVSGPRPGSNPTQADADRYRQDHHYKAEVKTDVGMKLYETYVSEGQHYIPMGASLEGTSVSRVFGPGRLDSDMVDYINR